MNKYSLLKPCKIGCEELRDSLLRSNLWVGLGLQDIKFRYRRSLLGPWWLTISTGITILALGFLWSKIYGGEIKSYLPYYSCGQIIWIFLYSQTNESCLAFCQFEAMIKQIRLPFGIYLLRILVRNVIIFAHNIVIFIIVLLYCGSEVNIRYLYFFPCFLIVSITMFGISVVLAILCVRFRDFVPIIGALTQLLFFFTPILWMPETMINHTILIYLNPFLYLVEILREPLIGHMLSVKIILVTLVICAASLILASFLIGKYKNRIAYWV